MDKLIVGLGNPGPRYVGTRHNVGLDVVAELARRHGVRTANQKLATEGKATIADTDVILAHPRGVFMNESGRAVQSLVNRHGVRDLAGVLVIFDDMDLPLGSVRLRPSGSAGGHNGLKSVIECLGSDEFARLRVGIGRPKPDVDPIEHVLDRFSSEEQAIVAEAIAYAASAAESWVAHGAFLTMNNFNRPRASTEAGE
ncbi:MAG: aminoacyl-tRNA hydrolase [Chloroflexi bacterium]|nr:aminoacyl-tRNA hydrolase [Chloroflexota bacterium]